MGKKFLTSKTLWVNLLAIVALGAQAVNGNWVISAEYQAMALTGINALLRLVTKEPIVW